MASKKNPQIEKMLNSFTKSAFGTERDSKQCAICSSTKVKPSDFRDKVSRKEFSISQMCQACQDEFFEEDY